MVRRMRISRRQALGYGVGALGLAALAGGVGGVRLPRLPGRTLAAGRQARALPQPRVLRSANGELTVRLVATPAVVDVGASQSVTTYTYDSVLPGSTWEVHPGDTL